MKVDELRVLEADELGMRLRSARRELYELRFKHAVGQLENSSGDVGEQPGKSYLFFLTAYHPGIRLTGDRVL